MHWKCQDRDQAADGSVDRCRPCRRPHNPGSSTTRGNAWCAAQVRPSSRRLPRSPVTSSGCWGCRPRRVSCPGSSTATVGPWSVRPCPELSRTQNGRSAVGQTLTVGDGRYDVAAVMPAEFGFPSAHVDMWLAAPAVAPEGSGSYQVVGRMRDGATFAQVREDAIRVARETRDAGGDGWSAAIRSVEETLLGELRPVVRVSIAAALLVLVVACANTVALLIGRSVLRRREFAVRIALGSGMVRLVRAALVEGLAIAAGGLVLGLAVAWVGLRLFGATAAAVVPRADAVAIELPVVLAGLVLTLLAGVVCGGASVVAACGGTAAPCAGAWWRPAHGRPDACGPDSWPARSRCPSCC